MLSSNSLFIAFTATAAYAQSCNTEALAKCGSDAAACIKASNTLDSLCICWGKNTVCWKAANCATGADYDLEISNCIAAECTVAQCNSATSVSAVFGLALAAVAALF